MYLMMHKALRCLTTRHLGSRAVYLGLKGTDSSLELNIRESLFDSSSPATTQVCGSSPYKTVHLFSIIWRHAACVYS